MRVNRQHLLGVFYWACAAILWTYMSVTMINLYKSWYITTACVCVVTLFLIGTGVLKTHGLFRSTGFVVIYFLYLLTTSTWAEYPDITISNVAIETIFIVIFALFYLLAMNFSTYRVINFFVYLAPITIIVFIASYLVDPEASRIGGYALFFLPFVLFFCVFRLIESFSIWNIVLVTACLLMLVLGMSRAPLLISGLGLLLVFVTITKRGRTGRKYIARFVLIGVLATLIIVAVPILRFYAAKTIVRITYKDMVVGDQVIEAEPPDAIRWLVYSDAFSLYATNWLLGIGYMNFMPWFGDTYGFRLENTRDKDVVGMNLHNVFQTWALEGGLPCLFIVTFLISKYFCILRTRIRHSKNDLEKSYCKLLIIVMICVLVEGLFNQIHQKPVFFIFLGIVYALDHKYGTIDLQALPKIVQ